MAATGRNFEVEAARRFHELTKHSYTSVRTGDHYLDWDNEPFKFKLYPQALALALPREFSLPRVPTFAALAGAGMPEAPSGPLNLERLARILFCAAGLTRTRRVGGHDYHFRAAASAGALYPIEVYLAAAAVDGLASGLYHFCPADLKLRTLREGDWREIISHACADQAVVANAGAVLFLSTIFWRSAWKYRARSYRYCFWDAGTILANLSASAAAEGVRTQIISAFVDREVEHLLGIDGEREGAICLVALDDPTSVHAPVQASAECGIQAPAALTLESLPLSAEERTYDELIGLHHASKLSAREEVEQFRSRHVVPASQRSSTPGEAASSGALKTLVLEPSDVRAGLSLSETILRRGSTRVFARKPISTAALAHVLYAASCRPQIDFDPLSDTYLIINAVEGVEPGAYFYRRESASLELLKAGEFRAQAGYLCLEQALGADCSVLLCFMADLEQVLQVLGNRGYRDAHLEAGILGGNAYLAAYALGLGATGLTFYDDDTSEFFAPYGQRKSPLLMVAIGVPAGAAAR
jgi:SagB-type dehydrogenase family enzyme